VDPEQLWQLGAQWGYRVELSWAASHPDGAYDAVLRRQAAAQHPIAFPLPDRPATVTAQALTNNPLQGAWTSAVVPELRRYLSERLPDYMVPTAYMLLDALPLTANGKIDRQALPTPDTARPDLHTTYIPPRTPIEEALHNLWTDLLGLDHIGIHDNFFGDCGGHSLLATQVLAHIREDLQVALPLTRFFDGPTIGELAAALIEDPSSRPDVEQRAELLLTVARLSEEEVDALLDSDSRLAQKGSFS
jgi:acyl carrier protein